MTQVQEEAYLCGMVPEEHDPKFFAQHLCAYAFTRPFAAGKRVLEVGFGSGYGTDYLAQIAADVTGIDSAEGNIPRAEAAYQRPNLHFARMDAAAMKFPDHTFDVVCTFQVIEHVPEPQLPAFVGELARVLKPDGVCCVSTLNLAQAMKPGKPYKKLCYHEKEFTEPELRELLRRSFSNVEMHGLYPSVKQRVYRRLKKLGLMNFGPARLNPIARFYERATVNDFVTKPFVTRHALDLYALCRKTVSC